ncbi:MAG: PorV/PorQ family protein [Elusimicrobia bacterium]|nr:PorV/PorQ family protein [Candidatus Liberimonas magnetica]
MNPDPEVVSMGDGSVGAYMEQPSVMLVNPAGLLGVDRSKLSINHIIYVEGIRYTYTGFAMPLSYGGVGFSLSYLSYGDIEGRDKDFNLVGVSQSNDILFTASYCLPIKQTIPVVKEYGSVGMNFKFVRSTLADFSAEAIAVDVGGIYRVNLIKGLTAGIVYKNLGSGLKFVKETNDLPQTLALGLNYKKYEAKNLNVVFDVGMPNQGPMSLSAGCSVDPIYNLSLRAGYKFIEDAFNSGVRAGFGINLGGVQIDYAFTPAEYFSAIHNISVAIPLGNIFSNELASEHYLNTHFQAAMDYYRSGDYVYAKQAFQEILEAYPGHKPSRQYLNKVNTALDELKKKQEAIITKYLLKGKDAVNAKDFITAKRYFTRILNLDENNKDAMSNLKAVDDTLKLVEAEKNRQMNKEKIEKEWKLAIGLINKGDYIAAKDKLDIMLKIDPGNKEAEKYVLTIENKLKQIAGTEVSKIFRQATVLYYKGNYEAAIKYFEAVILAAPDRLDAKDFLDKCNAKINEMLEKQKIEKIAQKQTKVKDQLAEVYNTALKYFEKNKFEQALSYFYESLKIANDYEFSEEVGRIKNYIAMSKVSLAEQYYKEGFSTYQKNDFEEAAKLYNQALRYDPDNAAAKTELQKISKQLSQSYYEKGMTYFSQGDMDKAKTYFQKSLFYDPKMKESLRAIERIK